MRRACSAARSRNSSRHARVVGQRIDAGEVLLGQAMPIGGGPAASGRAPHTGVTTTGAPARPAPPAAGGGRAGAPRGRSGGPPGRAARQLLAAARPQIREVSAPTIASCRAGACSAYSCSASSRSCASARSRSTAPGAARPRRPRYRRRARRGRRRSGSSPRSRRPWKTTVSVPLSGEPELQRDRGRSLGVDQRPTEQLVGGVIVHGGPPERSDRLL